MTKQNYKELYKSNLLEKVIPFWENYSVDKENGGFFTCLNKNGDVYDTDKFIWLQCRQVWTFSMLYQRVDQRESWLEMAKHGAEFLIKNGRNENKDWYFSLTKEGQPITQAFNIFSDCFAAMAFAQLSAATGNEAYSKIATETFDRILARQNNPKGKYSKAFPGTRDLQSFSLQTFSCQVSRRLPDLLFLFLILYFVNS